MVIDGVCEFCGQTNLTSECNCPEAQREKKNEQALEEAKHLIGNLFQDVNGDGKAMLESVAAGLIWGTYKKVKIDFDGYLSAIVKLDNKDNIIIERHYKSKQSEEVNCQQRFG